MGSIILGAPAHLHKATTHASCLDYRAAGIPLAQPAWGPLLVEL